MPPGEIRCRPLRPDATALSTMAHFHDPRELLALCKAIAGKASTVWAISVGGAEWDYSNCQLKLHESWVSVADTWRCEAAASPRG